MAQRSPRNEYSQGQRRDYRDRDYDDRDYQGRDYYDDDGRDYYDREERARQARQRSQTRQMRPVTSGDGRRRNGPPPARRRKKKKGGLAAVIAILVIVLLAVGAIIAVRSGLFGRKEQVIEVTKPLPEAPKVVSSATVGATGDIILHGPILEACAAGDSFDFSPIFNNVSYVFDQSDLMIANLEVTLGGTESGEYSSYPAFNSPDEIVPALRNAGVDLCLTANNHSNDTGYYGMMRTLGVLDDYGVEHLGSRETVDEHYMSVRNINGIRLGMLCYTYDTREYTEGEKSLNFNYLSDDAVQKIATFNYEYLDEFYEDIEQQLYYMDMLNVDEKVVFMHWGTEYEDYPNDYQQREIAQRLCDMGVDVIIGGHPHVIQEFEVLHSDDGHEMLCLYSMGNALSNQRRELMDPEEPRGYTEDGLVIQLTFEKFNNGKTRIGAVNIIPTWVQLDGNGYQIIALNGSDPWSWGSTDTYSAIDSYNRTMERLGSEYIDWRQRKHQDTVQEYIS